MSRGLDPILGGAAPESPAEAPETVPFWGCDTCRYFRDVCWVGERQYVDCAKRGRVNTDPARGCGLREPKGSGQRLMF